VKLFLHKEKPHWVINTAALTNVDGCETERDLAKNLNTQAVKILSNATQSIGGRFLQISTDYVFDGDRGPYGEEDPPAPLGFYGQTKRWAEEFLLLEHPQALIVRIIVLFGTGSGIRPNFFSWLLEGLGAGKVLKIVDDQIGSVTLASNLAQHLEILIKEEVTGIIHSGSTDCLSRYECARITARIFGLDDSLIHKSKTEDLGQAAKRPLQSGLKVTRLAKIKGVKLFSIAELIKIYQNELIMEETGPEIKPAQKSNGEPVHLAGDQ